MKIIIVIVRYTDNACGAGCMQNGGPSFSGTQVLEAQYRIVDIFYQV